MECRTAQPLLSEYIDNALSGRQTWDLDRHLGVCHECTRLLNELRRTAELTANAPKFEVSADFMDRLQTRLANVEPETGRAAWMDTIRSLFRPRILPAWGIGLATCTLAAILLAPRAPKVGPGVDLANYEVTARNQNVAISTADPFADTAAANLAAHVSTQPAGANDTTN